MTLNGKNLKTVERISLTDMDVSRRDERSGEMCPECGIDMLIGEAESAGVCTECYFILLDMGDYE